MRILFFSEAFNSLSQRLYCELTERGHDVSIEFAASDSAMHESVQLYEPQLILCPFLKRAVPQAIYRAYTTLIVHPGIKGDRGGSSLDWAIMDGVARWGVTVLEPSEEMDAGPIWATETFAMPRQSKASIYRLEVTQAAVTAVLQAVERFEGGEFEPEALDYSREDVLGTYRPLMQQADRAIDWSADDTETVLRKIRAADSHPGLLDEIAGTAVYLYDAHRECRLCGEPGELLAKRNGAICRATVDGAVWIGHLRPRSPDDGYLFKQPATWVVHEAAEALPETAEPFWNVGADEPTYQEIGYWEEASVGFLRFDFYNGAMGTDDCQRLLKAYRAALERDTRVLVLVGGADFFSNGIHLNKIEAACNPGEESRANLEAMNDVVRAILTTEDRITMALMQGNAAAGGVYLAAASDYVMARQGAVLNPHYANMGGLYGSEYWTFTLPRRVGSELVAAVMDHGMPMLARSAQALGLIDEVAGESPESARAAVSQRAAEWAAWDGYDDFVANKRKRLEEIEQDKSIDAYRREEMDHNRACFDGPRLDYHVARRNFVVKACGGATPRRLARHRVETVAEASGTVAARTATAPANDHRRMGRQKQGVRRAG